MHADGNGPEARRFLDAHPEVEFIDLLIADTNGIIRGKRVTRAALGKVWAQGVCLPGSLFGANICGDTVEATGLGFDQGDADRVCHPVAGSLCLTPWQPRPMAQCLLSMYESDGEPFCADPRHVLAGVLERFQPLGLRPVVAVELEFYLVDRERNVAGYPRPPCSPRTGVRESKTQVYGMDELDDYNGFFMAVADAVRIQGLPADTAVSEYAPGQYEVNLHHQPDAISACDHAVMLKRLIKAVALEHRMEATFMAKPYGERAGNGTHIHVSLVDGAGRNVMADGSGDAPALRRAVAGMLALMPESMAVFAPNANSFRRFQPGAFVPLAPTWGYNNRTTAIRVPGGAPEDTRVEHRVAGADANPYLLTAAVLAGIHHGLTEGLEPPPPTSGNACEQNGRELPATWDDALRAFASAAVLPEYLGAEFCRIFHANKADECALFHRHVTPLEVEWYLRAV